MALRTVHPAFIVAIVNDQAIIRCPVTTGSRLVVSLITELPRGVCSSDGPMQSIRTFLYSPNLVCEEFPQLAWDAVLEIDEMHEFFIGAVKNRCEVTMAEFSAPAASRKVRLRLYRIPQSKVKSSSDEKLTKGIANFFRDPQVGHIKGAVSLHALAEETQRVYSDLFRHVVGVEYIGSFRALIVAHPDTFLLVSHNAENKNQNEGLHDEKVVLRDVTRTMWPTTLAGRMYEKAIVDLLRPLLKESDSNIHEIFCSLSAVPVFRIGLSSAFSTMMHILQRNKETFWWTKDHTHWSGIIGLRNSREETDPVGRSDAQSSEKEF